MKKSTKNVIGIITGVAIATASAIFLGKNAKKSDNVNDNNANVEFETVSDEDTFEVEV